MDDTLVHGLGGSAIVLFILREVFNFVSKHRHANNKSSGAMSIDFWQREIRVGVREALEPFLSSQTEVLRGISDYEHKIHDGVQELVILARVALRKD